MPNTPEDFTGYPALEAVQALDRDKTFLVNALEHLVVPDAMREFLDQYEAWCEDQRKDGQGCHVARANLGYFTGYFSREVQQRWFNAIPHLSHPIFGRTEPKPEAAFRAGQKVGEAVKNGSSMNEAIKEAAKDFPPAVQPLHRDPKWK